MLHGIYSNAKLKKNKHTIYESSFTYHPHSHLTKTAYIQCNLQLHFFFHSFHRTTNGPICVCEEKQNVFPIQRYSEMAIFYQKSGLSGYLVLVAL